ncbi:somatolactin alpha [Chanos chanos]|uniref:Somatolactin alpha n=1 Tax=Chanos chanos TaxID=29144 RepID=A0A6J2UPR7_CHACN|nr:somatolactin-like [Chanos chanos]
MEDTAPEVLFETWGKEKVPATEDLRVWRLVRCSYAAVRSFLRPVKMLAWDDSEDVPLHVTSLPTHERRLQVLVWSVPLLAGWSVLSHPLDCKNEVGSVYRCASISQEKLLDRVIQHAELIYRVSEESCSMFEEMFIPVPMRPLRNQGVNGCITKAFPIPSSRSEVQQISDKWLLHSVLMLVQSWIEPMVYLQTTLDRYDDAPDVLLNKTRWVSDKLLSLEQGVVVLIRKMLDEGMLTSSVYEHGLAQYDTQPETLESVLRDYTLLTCFKKDAHRMETFLKLLKCRQTDKLNCIMN